MVLAGAGPTFCAGADIAWMRAAMALDVEGNEQDAMAMADMFEAIDTCPAPVVARVHGAALGGGMGLCAVADLVIAESGARFGFTETRLGILPAVIAPFVVAKIGETHARALFPGGRRFDAVRAQRIGLVHEVVEGEAALDAAVDERDRRRAGRGPDRGTSREGGHPRGPRPGPRSAKWHTARVIARQRVSAEAREGFAAFDEKRPPAWTPERDELGDRSRTTPDAPDSSRRRDRAALAPVELGRDFRWLWSASALMNLGDGALLAAGPLLVTTMHPRAVRGRDGRLPAAAPAGSCSASRPARSSTGVDRRRLSVVVNLARAIVLALLAFTATTGTVNLAIILTAMFLIGTAETFADIAGSALVATRVPKEHLGVANARLVGDRDLHEPARRPAARGAAVRGAGWPSRSRSMRSAPWPARP